MEFFIPRISDIIDILIIAFLIYQSLLILGKSGRLNIFYGFVLILAVYMLSLVLKLRMVTGLLNSIKDLWILIIIVLFQNEIRELFSRLNLTANAILVNKKPTTQDFASTMIDAISAMSFRRIGAIVILQKKMDLHEYINSGEIIDSNVSLRLILAIFNTKSVLHDGAIIIKNNRIAAAKVVLPLSKNIEYKQKYGTRHLAAIGISEKSDALTIVVSEQTGQVSITNNGSIQSDIAFEELMQIITDAIK